EDGLLEGWWLYIERRRGIEERSYDEISNPIRHSRNVNEPVEDRGVAAELVPSTAEKRQRVGHDKHEV
ncbi:5889_t:CDS:2, partial [Acaulospora colombiana]